MLKLGIDIGGTTIKGALIENGTLVCRGSAETHGKEGRRAILTQLYGLIEELLTPEVGFIGVASAGDFDPVRGKCVYATDNLSGWTGVELADKVSAKYGKPCRADNDAVCALLGELAFLPGKTDVTMLTFGTGVGGASLVNGKILRGQAFNAARWGHVAIEREGLPCNCGKRGCSEQYLSATALLRAAREANLDVADCKQLFGLYRAGEENAVKIVRDFGKRLLFLLDTVDAVLKPETIILGGGVATSRDILESLIGGRFGNVAFARLGGDAGVYGAGLLGDTEF